LDDPIFESEILGVTAVSKNSYWAVGRSFDNNEEEYRAVIFHWNGSKGVWKPATIELPQSLEGIDISLNAVAAPSSGPAWAVGSYAGIGSRRQTLILKWNNRVWKSVQTPNTQQVHNVLTGVTILGSTAWASGYTESPTNPDSGTTILLKKDGSQWKRANVNAPGDERPASDVLVIPGGAWAAGHSTCVVSCDPDKTSALVFSWDSRQKIWRGQPSLSYGTDNWLHAIDASSHRNVWVVGSYREAGGPLRTFAFRGGYCC
jgi:hypothetical protein